MNRIKIFLLLLFSGCWFCVLGQSNEDYKTIPFPDSLMKSTGRQMHITGTIYGGEYSAVSHLTILNLGDKFPDQTVSLIIKEDALSRFPKNPIAYYDNKNVSVKGFLEKVGGKLQIVVNDSSQIALPVKVKRNYKSP